MKYCLVGITCTLSCISIHSDLIHIPPGGLSPTDPPLPESGEITFDKAPEGSLPWDILYPVEDAIIQPIPRKVE